MGPTRGFRGVHSPRSRGGGEVASSVVRLCTPATRLPCAWGRDGGGRKSGHRGSRQQVGPSPLLFLRLDWLSGAVEPPPCSFIRSERGATETRIPSSSLSFSFCSPLSRSPWRKGMLVLQRWRRGSPLDN